MRCLKRNQTPFFYALYESKTPLTDDYGNKTGEYRVVYGKPVRMKANISAQRGETIIRQFGEDVRYDRVIVLEGTVCPIEESSVLWIDTLPVLDKDGKTLTPHDYVVSRVAKGLNSTAIAVSKVNVRG